MKRIVLAGFICVITVLSYSQTALKRKAGLYTPVHALSIGDNVPASVWSRISKKETTKLVILDFWNSGCVECLEAFPGMEKLQKQFIKELQVVLVNPWQDEAGIKQQMDRINISRHRIGEEPFRLYAYMPAINGDTVFRRLFPTYTIPQHVWIDKNGKVLYITYGYNATANHVQRVLNGEHVKMTLKKDLALESFNVSNGILKKTHESIVPAFYSCFAKYNPGLDGGYGTRTDSASGMVRNYYSNTPVITLYRLAFGFAYNNKILLEIKDKRDYKYPSREEGDIMDDWYEKNSFNYELAVPFSEVKNMNIYMQQDLNRFFGIEKRIEGFVAKRKLNCIILTGAGNDLLKAQKEGRNYSIVSDLLANKLQDMNAGRPFLDETGIDPELKVAIHLTGDLKNIDNVRKQLRPYGLDIIEAEREVEVLVIRDK